MGCIRKTLLSKRVIHNFGGWLLTWLNSRIGLPQPLCIPKQQFGAAIHLLLLFIAAPYHYFDFPPSFFLRPSFFYWLYRTASSLPTLHIDNLARIHYTTAAAADIIIGRPVALLLPTAPTNQPAKQPFTHPHTHK